MIHGIDVSSAQAVGADWNAAKASGVAYAWVKASEGNKGRDPAYQRHLDAASEAGVWAGAYHFCRPNFGGVTPMGSNRDALITADAHAEAENFFNATAGWGGQSETMPPLLDVETCDPSVSAAEFVAWVQVFSTHVKESFGVVPIIYTGAPMAQRGGRAWSSALWLRDMPLMIAAYPLPPPSPDRIGERVTPRIDPWSKATIWQYSGGGVGLAGNKCPGFGSVWIDRSVAYVDSLDDLRVVA